MTAKEPPKWNRDAAEALRSFFQGPIGSAVFMHLANMRPIISAGEAGNDLNKAALSGQFAAGYEACLKAFVGLTEWSEDSSVRTVENYPDVEDDKAFEDGQNLEEARKQAEKNKLNQ
jgi:hypothetical protein